MQGRYGDVSKQRLVCAHTFHIWQNTPALGGVKSAGFVHTRKFCRSAGHDRVFMAGRRTRHDVV